MRLLNRIFICTCFLIFSAFSYADAPILPKSPSVVFSENREYFAVHIPYGLNTDIGYLAVFNSKSFEIQFKLDSLEIYDFKLSNDGQKIYSLQIKHKVDENIYLIAQYVQNKGYQEFPFLRKERHFDDEGYEYFSYPYWNLKDERIELKLDERSMFFSLTDFSLKNLENETLTFTKQSDSLQEEYKEFAYGLKKLRSDTSEFVTDLVSHLGYNVVESIDSSNIYCYLRIYINKYGELIDYSIFTQYTKKGSNICDGFNEVLMEKIDVFLHNYKFSKKTVAIGLDYWYYSGKLYLTNL